MLEDTKDEINSLKKKLTIRREQLSKMILPLYLSIKNKQLLQGGINILKEVESWLSRKEEGVEDYDFLLELYMSYVSEVVGYRENYKNHPLYGELEGLFHSLKSSGVYSRLIPPSDVCDQYLKHGVISRLDILKEREENSPGDDKFLEEYFRIIHRKGKRKMDGTTLGIARKLEREQGLPEAIDSFRENKDLFLESYASLISVVVDSGTKYFEIHEHYQLCLDLRAKLVDLKINLRPIPDVVEIYERTGIIDIWEPEENSE